MCPLYKKAAQATAAVLPIDFQETSTLNEVKQDDSSEAMVRVYQPPVVNNSRGQTSGQQSINGFQVLFYNMFIRCGHVIRDFESEAKTR